MTIADVIGSVQYLVDDDGKRTAAVVQMNMWQDLLDMLGTTDLDVDHHVADEKTPEQVIADVQIRPVRSESVILPKGSLLEALPNPTYDDKDFDLDTWTKQWQAVEKEMKAITQPKTGSWPVRNRLQLR